MVRLPLRVSGGASITANRLVVLEEPDARLQDGLALEARQALGIGRERRGRRLDRDVPIELRVIAPPRGRPGC